MLKINTLMLLIDAFAAGQYTGHHQNVSYLVLGKNHATSKLLPCVHLPQLSWCIASIVLSGGCLTAYVVKQEEHTCQNKQQSGQDSPETCSVSGRYKTQWVVGIDAIVELLHTVCGNTRTMHLRRRANACGNHAESLGWRRWTRRMADKGTASLMPLLSSCRDAGVTQLWRATQEPYL